ncbi:hypothetical protein [Comamonas antarctica]|uniref:hypothetical protein n=1 Tax=Comamonas antarctica TaxID=2743470 RepID=UPI0028E51F39|nr:hypothetical protein [Comamonas antarctica]
MNLFKRFERLLPRQPLRVGQVLSVNGTQVRVREQGGVELVARGEAAAGDRVYFRNGVIEGDAPNLPLEVIEE